MRLFKTLFKNFKKDVRNNLKQLIAIIFILGIAVTLFSGLYANSDEFERRVNYVYSDDVGNAADVWLTLNPDTDNAQKDFENLKMIDSRATQEARFLFPSRISGISTYALIYNERPTINKEYDCEYNYNVDLTRDFFFVDKTTIAKYEEKSQTTFTLGDSLPVEFDLSSYLPDSNTLDSLVDQIYQKVLDFSGSDEANSIKLPGDLSWSTVHFFLTISKDTILENIKEDLHSRFSSGYTISIDLTPNGIMSSPENIQNGDFSTTNFILSQRTFANGLISKYVETFDYEKLYKEIQESTVLEENKDTIVEACEAFVNVINLYDLFSNKEEIINLINEFKDNVENETLKQKVLDAIGGSSETFKAFIEVYSKVLESDIVGEEGDEYFDKLKYVYNQIIFKCTGSIDGDSLITQIKKYYSDNYPDETKILAIMDRENYPSNAVIQNDIAQSRSLAISLPILFFVVATLVVLTTISQVMLKQRTQIGTMKAIGITKGNILLYYLVYMNFVGILGVILGLICGPIIIPRVMNIKYSLLYSLPTIQYNFPWFIALICLFGIIFLISLLTYIVIRKELSYVPALSMRAPVPTMKFKEKKRTIKDNSLMMALRNIKVHFSKSLMVILGVAGCTGLLICGFGIEDTINYGKDLDMSSYLDSDFIVTYGTNTQKGVNVDDLLTIDGVKEVSEYYRGQITLSHNNKNSDSSIFYFSYKSPFFKFDDNYEDGHWDLSKVALAKEKAEELGVKEGDTVSFSFNGEIHEYEVDKIFYSFASSGAIFIYEETAPDLISSMTYAWVNFEHDSKGTMLVNESKAREELLAKTYITSLVSKSENAARIESYMSSIQMMTNTVKVFAILLAVVVLINLAILNFQERIREIATLRVLGFSRLEIGRSLIYEVMILTFFGALLGLFLGWPLEYLILSTNITPLVAYAYVIYWQSYLIGFLISLLTAFIVNLYITARINKVNMAESLKSVE